MKLLRKLALLCLLPALPVLAQERDPFIVTAAEFRLEETLLSLDLVIDSDMPGYIEIAIDQGFAVPMMFEVEIRSRKRY